jgi:hypothetical protein
MKTKIEKWVDSYYFPEKYEVSNSGIVRNKITKRIYKTAINYKGYEVITISCNYKRVTIPIHRLEYLSFYPDTILSQDIHHLDGNKLNNKLSNLGAIDKRIHCSIHIRERIKAGNWNLNKTPIYGAAHPSYKGMILAICPKTNEILHKINGTLELTNLGFHPSNVSRVILGKRNRHKGLIFKRVPNN